MVLFCDCEYAFSYDLVVLASSVLMDVVSSRFVAPIVLVSPVLLVTRRFSLCLPLVVEVGGCCQPRPPQGPGPRPPDPLPGPRPGLPPGSLPWGRRCPGCGFEYQAKRLARSNHTICLPQLRMHVMQKFSTEGPSIASLARILPDSSVAERSPLALPLPPTCTHSCLGARDGMLPGVGVPRLSARSQ